MTDYGHDLMFGVVLTPDSRRPERVLELAQLADRQGLDLVAVSDHAYNPGFLDAWTLLSVIADRTRTVHVLPDVANLALRPPAGLARAAAALDVLSGGRVELGLGAGGYPDAIFAEGGPARTAGEHVAALEDAMIVMRGILESDDAISFTGDYHHIAARPGPIHPHHIGLWIGAVGPRSLRLTGRLGDGWLPSASRVPPARLAEATRIIDESARNAGRDPGEIRRLYNVAGSFGHARGLFNGPPAEWAEQLATITLTHGTSAYLLFTDDADEVSAFAAEVAPAARDTVARER